mgnify:CR=1 FL=1
MTGTDILDDPDFRALVRARRRYSWALAIITCAVFGLAMLVFTMAPGLLAQPTGLGFGITLGMLSVLGLILFPLVAILLYVHRVNSDFAPRLTALAQKRG